MLGLSDAKEASDMASVFTRIIRGELPGRFLWRDDRAVAFLTIEPLRPGHTLVVPIREVDHWIDLEPELASHLMRVAQTIGKAQQHEFRPRRVGMVIVGIEVPHVHLHVVPIDAIADLDFSRADRKPRAEDLDAAAARLRAALRGLGCREVAD
jgi:histidine triad (HIT) family protein